MTRSFNPNLASEVICKLDSLNFTGRLVKYFQKKKKTCNINKNDFVLEGGKKSKQNK